MCGTRNSRRISIQGRNIRVDGCMAEKIVRLNELGVVTLGCCCGHGRYPTTIIVKSSSGTIYDSCSAVIVPRTRNFYKTDDDGFYYLPELSEPLSSKESVRGELDG